MMEVNSLWLKCFCQAPSPRSASPPFLNAGFGLLRVRFSHSLTISHDSTDGTTMSMCPDGLVTALIVAQSDLRRAALGEVMTLRHTARSAHCVPNSFGHSFTSATRHVAGVAPL